MRKVFYASVLVWLSLLCSVGRAAHVRFPLQTFTTLSVTGRVFKIVAETMPIASGGAIILKEPFTTNTGNGVLIVSNLVIGTYDCTVSTPVTPTTFRIAVPDTNTLVDATNLLITTAANTTPDEQFVKKLSSWSSSQILTNPIFNGSTNLGTLTNGAVAGYVLTSFAGGGLALAPAPGASGGEANVLGHLGTTNTTDTFSLEGTKSGVSLLLPPLRAGASMALTNQGTNIVLAVDTSATNRFIATLWGNGTNATFRSSDSNNFAVQIWGAANQRSNLLQFLDVNSNVLANFGPAGGLHIGGSSSAGQNNLLVDGAGTFTGSVGVGNQITLTASSGQGIFRSIALDIGSGQFVSLSTNIFDLNNAAAITGIRNSTNFGASEVRGDQTNALALNVKGASTLYGPVSNLTLTASQLTGTDGNKKLISYSAGTGIAFGSSSVALNEAGLPIVASLYPTNLVRAQDGTGASESITVSNFFNSIAPSYFVAIGDSLTADNTYSSLVPIAYRVPYGADWFTKLITRSNYFFRGKSYNVARGGAHAYEWVSTFYDSDVIPIVPATTNKALLFVHLGINDIDDGRTFQQVTNDLGVLWTRGWSNNFAVVAFTIPTNSTGFMSAAENQNRTNVNVWIRTNTTLWYKLVDADLVMTNSVIAQGTVDGIHWLPSFNENLAQNIWTNLVPLSLQSFWGKLDSPSDLNVKGIKATNAIVSSLLEVQGTAIMGTLRITNFDTPTAKQSMELLYDPSGVNGGFIQGYDRDNLLYKDISLIGQILHLIPIGSLRFENMGAAAGYNLVSTDTLGTTAWQVAPTTAAPLNSYLVKNGAGTIGSLTGNSNDIVRSYNAMSFPYLSQRLATNGTFMAMEMGDSLNGLSGNIGSDFFGQEMMNYFVTNYGYAGALGQAQNASWYWLPRVTAPAYVTNNDFTTWYCSHWVLPNTGILIASNNVGNGQVLGNVYEVDYLGSNGFGGFTVETNANGGAYATLATLVANVASGFGKTGLVYRFTNTVSVPTTLRITCISNTVKILGVGIMNYNTNGGVIVNDLAYNSTDLSQFGLVPTNVMYPILRAWKPDLAIYKCIDGSGSFISANLPLFNQCFDAALTNTDLLVVGLAPVETSDMSVILQNLVWFTNCIARRQSYFDGYSIFGDWTNGVRLGYLKTGNDPHFTQAGAVFEADAIASGMNVFNTAHRGFWDSPPFPYSLRTNNFTVLGTLESAVFTNRAAGDIGGALNVFGAETNWNTVRNKAGVTNDVNVLTVGNAEFRGTVTNTGAINNAAASTNWGTTVIPQSSFLLGPSAAAITNLLSGSANLDFPSTSPSKASDLSITVTGTGTNDVVQLGVPPVCAITNCFYWAFPSNDTVWVRFFNNDTNTAQNPGPGVFKVLVTKF